jgi:hypothetical protein
MTEPNRPVPGPPRPGPWGGAAPVPAAAMPDETQPDETQPDEAQPADTDDGTPFADLDRRPVAQHVAVFEAEHARLQRELGTIDQL